MALRSLMILGSLTGSVGISIPEGAVALSKHDTAVVDVRRENIEENIESEMGICACKAWNTVYTGDQRCGTAAEYFFITQKTHDYVGEFGFREWYWLNKTGGTELCENFYKKITGNGCILMDTSMHAPHDAWCYVDHGCHSLNGGKLADDGRLKWKMCVGGDSWYMNMDPPTLLSTATSYGVDVPLMFRMSYPSWTDHTWDRVSAFWTGMGKGEAYYMDPILYKEMAKIAQGKLYTVINMGANGHVPLIVVKEWKVWQLAADGTLSELQ